MAVTGRVKSDPNGELFSDISEVVPFLDARDATGIKESIHPYEPTCWKSHADASHFSGWDVKFLYCVRNPIQATRSFLDFVYPWLLEDPPQLPALLEKIYAKFVERFLLSDPDRQIADWFTHTQSFLQSDAKVLFLVFEDVIRDISGTVRQVCRYLDIEVSDEQVEHVVRKCDRKSMAQDVRFNDISISKLMGWKLCEGRRVRADDDGLFKRVHLDPKMERRVWTKFERVFSMKSHDELVVELRRRNSMIMCNV
ncbi:Sulfotransferase [Gracilaria domingensis]|nr:Sulfotransferase [Gracilaria domingensis]